MQPQIKPFRRATNITDTYNAVNPEQPLQPGISVMWIVCRGVATNIW